MPLKTLSNLAERVAATVLRTQGFRSRHVDTAVGRLHALDWRGAGTLPPVVMIHGFTAASVHWYPLLVGLQPHCRRVLAPDLPGHGFSTGVPSGLDANVLADGLLEALDAWIGEPVVLLGNSMGGAAAVRYAARRPENVRGLVLISPGGAPMEADELERFRDGIRMDHPDQALDFVDRLFHTPATFRRFLAHGVRERFRRPAMRALIEGIGPEHMLTADEVASITCPTLFLWGRSERILPRSNLAFFRGALPAHARVDEPEGWGHSPYLERPSEVLDRILAFVRSVDEQERASDPGLLASAG
jgi:pimeloyl-ACP methyl ester carboxylesterase